VQRLARAHQQGQRHRRDFHQKVALPRIQTHDTLDHEDVQTVNMVKNHHRAQSISDAGWSQFVSIRAATAAAAGRRVVAVLPADTSQTCSGCGVSVANDLSVRWHSCPDGGPRLQRDHHAARNREGAGQALRGGVAVAASEHRASPGLSRGECQ
jgi:putative transposase